MDKERRRKELIEVMKKIAVLRKRRKDDDDEKKTRENVQYHGPYTDGSGQKFYLPRKIVNNKLQSVDYRFENDDMDGDRLVTNLSWLGRSGELMKMVADNDNEDDDDDEDDEDSTYPGTRKRRKVIGGGATMASEDTDYMSERSLRKALPDISQIMRNWTVHGQNLGDVVDSYVRNSRTMPIKKRLKIGNFLNTASNVLDTIGSMTENTIINSVQFRRGGGRSLRGGGGIIGHQGTHSQNYPPSVLLKGLPATEDNVSRYTARYVDRSIDRNVIVPGETFNEIMYSGQFPVHPQGVQLAHNPQKVNVDFHRGYDDDDGSSLGESDEELKGVDSSGELTSSSSSSDDNEDSESSYV